MSICNTVFRVVKFLGKVVFFPILLITFILMGPLISMVEANNCEEYKREFKNAFKLIIIDYLK